MYWRLHCKLERKQALSLDRIATLPLGNTDTMSVDNITLPLDSITILLGLNRDKPLDNIAIFHLDKRETLHLDNTTARYHSETVSILLSKSVST